MAWGRSSNVFLGNGSRLYLDVGSHPEYATAECTDLLDVVAHDRAGEIIVQDLADDAEQRLAEEGFDATVYVLKNNVDSRGNSYGSHENYLIERRTRMERVTETLVPFLVTRQLVTGAAGCTSPSNGRPTSSRSARTTCGRTSARPPPGPARSSTPATSRTPTRRSTAVCTSSSATPR
ncbi:hypothetical protein BJF82_15515 [Kytococcus sp. CUA-901]|nr:hypothetical protein BJF82_15515 [Kytococcus sp. CUA-901]